MDFASACKFDECGECEVSVGLLLRIMSCTGLGRRGGECDVIANFGQEAQG